MKIPRRVNLPFGYVIQVKQLTRSEFTEECGECYAMWESLHNGGIIYVSKGRNIKKRRADFAHEMMHAVADWQVWALDSRHVNVRG